MKPTSGIITLDFTETSFNAFELKIINSKGQVIYEDQVQINEMNVKIDLAGNTKGIYFLLLQNPEFKGVQKIILE